MDPLLTGLATRNHGLITSADLRSLGVSTREVGRWLRSGDLVSVRRACYTTRDLWESWDEMHDRPVARARAAHLSTRIEHAMSHESAALMWKLPLVNSRAVASHLTRRDKRATRMYGGVWHH